MSADESVVQDLEREVQRLKKEVDRVTDLCDKTQDKYLVGSMNVLALLMVVCELCEILCVCYLESRVE